MFSKIKQWFERSPKQVEKEKICRHSKLVKAVFSDENYNIAMSDKDKVFATGLNSCPDCNKAVMLQFNYNTFKNYKPDRTWY
jgi:hypothetical protein